MSSQPRPDAHEERVSARERRAIIDVATESFLSMGYEDTRVDDIADIAGVSKQTFDKHFPDKERLFSDFVNDVVHAVCDPIYDEVRNINDSGDVEADLRDLARRLLARVILPLPIKLRRLVIAEAGRFPDLGGFYHEQGPARTRAALASAFDRLAAQGVLRLEDPILAAAHFDALIVSIPLNEGVLWVFDYEGPPDPADLDRYADTGVRVFLAAYGHH
jgi:TetR/AcrR family transcriptional repressor of mexJK operon